MKLVVILIYIISLSFLFTYCKGDKINNQENKEAKPTINAEKKDLKGRNANPKLDSKPIPVLDGSRQPANPSENENKVKKLLELDEKVLQIINEPFTKMIASAIKDCNKLDSDFDKFLKEYEPKTQQFNSEVKALYKTCIPEEAQEYLISSEKIMKSKYSELTKTIDMFKEIVEQKPECKSGYEKLMNKMSTEWNVIK